LTEFVICFYGLRFGIVLNRLVNLSADFRFFGWGEAICPCLRRTIRQTTAFSTPAPTPKAKAVCQVEIIRHLRLFFALSAHPANAWCKAHKATLAVASITNLKDITQNTKTR
jgi:hypothetical protein